MAIYFRYRQFSEQEWCFLELFDDNQKFETIFIIFPENRDEIKSKGDEKLITTFISHVKIIAAVSLDNETLKKSPRSIFV